MYVLDWGKILYVTSVIMPLNHFWVTILLVHFILLCYGYRGLNLRYIQIFNNGHDLNVFHALENHWQVQWNAAVISSLIIIYYYYYY
jgi:hypothetical protein